MRRILTTATLATITVALLALATPAWAITNLQPSAAMLGNDAGRTNGCDALWRSWYDGTSDTGYQVDCQRSWDNWRVTQQVRVLTDDQRVGELLRAYTYRSGAGYGTGSGLLYHCESDPTYAPAGRDFVHRLKVTVWNDDGPKYRATIDVIAFHPMC
jgi:hypothetical protein